MSDDEDIWQVVESRRRRPRRGSFSKTTSTQISCGGGSGSISAGPGVSNSSVQGGYTYTMTYQPMEHTYDDRVRREIKRLEQIKSLLRGTALWVRVVKGLRSVFLQLGLEQANRQEEESSEDEVPGPSETQASPNKNNIAPAAPGEGSDQRTIMTPDPSAPLVLLEELVCYGVGSFSESHNSRYQLALALCLRDLLSSAGDAPQRAPSSGSSDFPPDRASKDPGSKNDRARPPPPAVSSTQGEKPPVDGRNGSWRPGARPRMIVFDPVMSETDKAILIALGCSIPHDEMGKRCCGGEGGGGCAGEDGVTGGSSRSRARATPTLFFMPHCPWRLYSNLLWANWFPGGLGSVIILGNALSIYRDNMHLLREADPSNALLRTAPLFNEIRLICFAFSAARASREERAERLPYFWTAFNDLTLSFSGPELRSSAAGAKALADRPPEHVGEFSL